MLQEVKLIVVTRHQVKKSCFAVFNMHIDRGILGHFLYKAFLPDYSLVYSRGYN